MWVLKIFTSTRSALFFDILKSARDIMGFQEFQKSPLPKFAEILIRLYMVEEVLDSRLIATYTFIQIGQLVRNIH